MPDDPKPDPEDNDDDPKPDPDAGAKKALDEERKARRDAEKRLKELEGKVKEFEDRDKSEGEKLTDKIAAAEKRAADAEARALRSEVAMSKGLTAGQAKRLAHDAVTREDLEADADDILENFPAKDGANPPPIRKPAADLKGGSDPTEEADIDVRKVVESIPRGL
jgi:cell division septum initiation protein DivIVA